MVPETTPVPGWGEFLFLLQAICLARAFLSTEYSKAFSLVISPFLNRFRILLSMVVTYRQAACLNDRAISGVLFSLIRFLTASLTRKISNAGTRSPG